MRAGNRSVQNVSGETGRKTGLFWGNRSPGGTSRSLDRLIDFASQLVETDFTALTRAMAELAQGNLSARLAVSSQPLRRDDFPGFERLADVVNAMLAKLQVGAAEFNAATEPPCHRLCYVGADSYLEGYMCGQAMGKALSGRGQVAVLHRPSMVSHQLRRKGFQMALLKEFPGISVVYDSDCGTTLDDAYRVTSELLKNLPAVDGIYFTHGGVPAGVARAVEEAGRAGRTKVVCHDFGNETMACVKKGAIAATLGQDPYAQGHEPVIHLFNHLVAGWQPPTPRLLTELELATPENCDQFWQEGVGAITREEAQRRLSHPVDQVASKQLRIAVLGRAPNSFWDQVEEGVKEAAAKIRPLHASAEWIVPELTLREGRTDAGVYGPLLDSLIERGYDGLAVGVFDARLVFYINRATRRGIPVVTYNAEPGGLSSMVLLTTEQAYKLLQVSQKLAASIDQITQATEHVKVSIDQVSRSTIAQNEQVSQANESLDGLVNRIDEVTREARQGSSLAVEAADASKVGTEAVSRTLHSMKSIQASVSATGQTVERLGTSSERIDVIIRLIGSIAYQIKLLGINAAIEAAHAGQYGAGFSVVAGEIRSLGERSASATREITEIVEKVQNGIHDALRVMASELQQVEAGADLAERAGKLLENIRGAVVTNKDRLASIADAVSQMQAFSRKVGTIMQELTAITEENSSAAEEVGAAANEMLAELTRVDAVAHSLAQMARATEQLLAKFTLSDADRPSE
ncbi:MAG: substrate-binding domain-containing protein [Acidobacteriota bacterium]